MLAAAEQRRRASGSVASAEEVVAVESVEATIRAAVPAQRQSQSRTQERPLSLNETIAFVLALTPVVG